MKILFLLLLVVNCYGVHTHTIYVSGPDTDGRCNRKWLRQSKRLYDAIKREEKSRGNTTELFPKRDYREKIHDRHKDRRKYLKSSELKRRYYNVDVLANELMDLVIKRRDEIVGFDDIDWDTRIHLRSHGLGYQVLERFTNKQSLVASLISFDGDPDPDDSGSNDISDVDLEELVDIYFNKVKKRGVNKDYIKSQIKNMQSNHIIININTSDDDIWTPGNKCSTKKAVGTLVAIATILGTILAFI